MEKRETKNRPPVLQIQIVQRCQFLIFFLLVISMPFGDILPWAKI